MARAYQGFWGLCLIPILFSVAQADGEKESEAYVQSIEDWREKRLEALKSPEGYLALVGLYALKDGAHSFGTDSSNDLVLELSSAMPGAEFIGDFLLNDGHLRFTTRAPAKVLHDDRDVSTIVMNNDAEGNPTVLALGSLRWHIIDRSGDILLRVRDHDSPGRSHFNAIAYYPISSEWRIEADLIPHKSPTELLMPNILGTIAREVSQGILHFRYGGKSYTLDAGDGGERLFIVFGDATNTHETYGGGRFIYVERPTRGGKTVIDFNRAYNPPCAYNAFTTCPLPPKQNKLPLEIRAGEMYESTSHP